MKPWHAEVLEDHETLKKQLNVFQDTLCGDQKGLERYAALCRILRVIGPDLELHLKKEEEVVFPALDRLAAGPQRRALAALRKQHDQLREILHRLAGLLCQCEGIKKLKWAQIAKAGRAFIDLLTEHEQREDRLLAEVLESGLKPAELMQLGQQLNQVAWKAREEGL